MAALMWNSHVGEGRRSKRRVCGISDAFAHIVELPTIREDMVYQVDFQVEEVLTRSNPMRRAYSISLKWRFYWDQWSDIPGP